VRNCKNFYKDGNINYTAKQLRSQGEARKGPEPWTTAKKMLRGKEKSSLKDRALQHTPLPRVRGGEKGLIYKKT